MQMSVRKPAAPLSPFVEMFWHWEGYRAEHTLEHCLPTGTMELVFSLGGGRAEFAGPASRYFLLPTSKQIAVLGVHFKPGGGFPFLRMPAGELADRQPTLEDVWGRDAAAVEDRVSAARTVA